jgi:hypothetical protein
MFCSKKNCCNDARHNGLCLSHYRKFLWKRRLLAGGDPNRTKRTPSEIELRKTYALVYLYDSLGIVVGKAKIDLEDVVKVKDYPWSLRGYAQNSTLGKMHRYLMGAEKDQRIDHINRKKLDNRKENLRFYDKTGNSANIERQKNNTTGAKGVTWDKARSKYRAQITVQVEGKRKSVYLGLFEDLVDAARAYNIAAKEYFGEFACCNDIKKLKQSLFTA